MSNDPTEHPGGPQAPGATPSGEPSEEQLRAAYEAELSRITSADMMLQAAVTLLNIGGYRLGSSGDRPAGGPEGTGDTMADRGGAEGAARDLEQVRDAIDGVRALLGILERRMSRELGPLRDALSRLQMAYAHEVQAGAGGAPSGPIKGQGGEPGARPAGAPGVREGPGQKENGPAPEEQPGGPGPAESSGRLWVPGR